MNRMVYDAVVLGGGIIGMSLARRLSMDGANVAAVEKNLAGSGASNAAGGMLAPQSEAEGPGPFLDLCLASRKLFDSLVPELEEETGVRLDYDPAGLICLALGEQEERGLEEKRLWQTEMGLKAERLTREEAIRLEPGLKGSRLVSALFFPWEARFDNVRYMLAVKLSALKYGVRLFENAAVLGYERTGGRVTGVKTTLGTLHAGVAINAMGSWGGLLDAPPGPETVRPVRGQIVELRGNAPLFRRPVKWEGGYLVPRSDGRLLAGSTMEDTGFDARCTAEGLLAVLRGAAQAAPSIRELPFQNAWAGLRPGTPDGLPILGRSDLEGLYLALGHFRNGMLLSPVTAWLMGDLILKGKGAFDLGPFSAARFEGPAANGPS